MKSKVQKDTGNIKFIKLGNKSKDKLNKELKINL